MCHLSWKKEKDEHENQVYNKLLETTRLNDSEAFIIKAHEWQFNKVDKKPFHNHPIWVAKIISWYIDSNLSLIEAWLAHDVIEDCDNWEKQVQDKLWDEVLELVQWVTEIDKSYSWDERKDAYINHLSEANTQTLIVSLADHIHNLHRILGEYLELWEKLWDHFWAKKDKKINYFYRYADKLASLNMKNDNSEFFKVYHKMFSDFVIILDYFGEITQAEVNLDIEFDYNEFVSYYNEASRENWWFIYMENENTRYLIYDYVSSGTPYLKEFAKKIYQSEQEY